MRNFYQKLLQSIRLLSLILIFAGENAFSQSLDVASCGVVTRRNNGNGQYAYSAGIFPGYGINNPVAANVVGTPYQTVPYDPATKTGYFTFTWNSATPMTGFPVITRVWITPQGSSTAQLSPTKFGPPSPPEIVGNAYSVTYSFYVQNLPPGGRVTFEFSDPQTNQPAFNCTFDLQSNNTAATPTISCAPTINIQPSAVNICGQSTATISISGDGIAAIQWQSSPDGVNNWVNLSNSGDYSGTNSTTLTISNPVNYSGKFYRAVLTGGTGCGTTLTQAVQLLARNLPTAVFQTTTHCGTGSQSLGVTLTGAPPWSLTCSATPSGGSATTTTVTNITSSPYFFQVNPLVTTNYVITSVSDAYCSNGSPSGNTTAAIYASPTVSPQNATACYGSQNFSLNYTTTGNPDHYNLTAGVRAVPGFAAIVNAGLSASPVNITLPSNTPVGTYDFNLTVSNQTSGCTSASMPITLTIYSLPAVSATAASSTICAGTSTTLNAAPSNLSSYAWSSNPASSVSSVYNPVVNPTSNTSYTVTGTDAHGCSASSSVSIVASPGPAITLLPSSPTICNGNAVTLTASGGNTYNWSPATGLSATTGDVVVASPSSTTTYTITSQNITGCQSIGTVTVTVTSPAITVSPDETICKGSVKTLTASGGSTYAWYPVTGLYTDAAATTAYTGTSLATVYAKPSVTSTYYVVGTTAGGCQGINSTTITISNAPVNTSTSTQHSLIFCVQGVSSFDLTVNTTVSVSSMSWAYSPDGTDYTNINAPYTTSSAGIKFTPTITSTSAVLNLTNWGSSGYTGERYFRLTIVGSQCTYYYDIFITDTKGTDPTLAPTASQTTICSGNSVTLTAGNFAAGTTAQWQSSTNNSTWVDITGATSENYTASPSVNTYYRVVFNTGVGNCGSTSNSRLITVISGMDPNTISPPSTCTDGSSLITLNGSAVSGGLYQWQYSTTSSSAGFSNILGATSQHYTLPVNIVPSTRWYSRVASTSTCATGNSNVVAVYAPISNNQITNSPVSYCGSAASLTLTGTTPAGGDGSYAYQWMYSTDGTNFSNVPSGGNSRDYTTQVQSQTYWYKRYITSGGCSDMSSLYKVQVTAVPSVSIAPQSGICAGSSVSLTASGANSYTWSPATELSSVTGNGITATPTSSRTYTVTGKDGNGCTNTAYINLNVTALPSNPGLSSAGQTICSGSVNLTSYVNAGAGTSWYTAPEANAAYLVSNPSSVSASGTYYVFSSAGGCFSSGYAGFTLNHPSVIAPTVNASALALCSPETANLNTLQPAAATGISYEWHTVASNPGSGNLVADPGNAGSGTYYLYAFVVAGTCYSPASAPVTVSIHDRPQAVVSATAVSVCQPATVDLTQYNSTPGSNSYNWYSGNAPDPENLVAFPTQVSQTGTYYLFATNENGCAGPPSDGIDVSINVRPLAGISSPDPFCGNVLSGISATTDIPGAAFLWQTSTDGGISWSALAEGNPYSGVNSQHLGIVTSQTLSGSYYRCIVSGPDGCSDTSFAAILVGENPPSLTENPTDTSVLEGAASYFESAAGSSPTFTYSWLVSENGGASFDPVTDNTLFNGFTSPTLTIPHSVMSLDSSLYIMCLSNSCGILYSDTALLRIQMNTLPVTLLYFTARLAGNSVMLNWSTASETNAEIFLLQHSSDFEGWREIGQVEASGNSASQKYYAFEDTQPAVGYNYYRLLQRDLDGKISPGEAAWVLVESAAGSTRCFPNPVLNGKMTIWLETSQPVSLYNILGEKVLEVSMFEGPNTLDLTMLQQGLYYLHSGKDAIPVIIK